MQNILNQTTLPFPFPTVLPLPNLISTSPHIFKFMCNSDNQIQQQSLTQIKYPVIFQNSKTKISFININLNFNYKFTDQQTILITASKNTSQKLQQLISTVSMLLNSTYQFKIVKSKQRRPQPLIYYDQTIPNMPYVIQLSKSKNYSKQLANQRANVATVEFMQNQCRLVANQNNLKIQIYPYNQLKQQRLFLVQHVGRASIHKPIFVNLSYNGLPQSSDWIALIGKGLCYDSGGLSIKTNSEMQGMQMDKHGATSVLSAIRGIARLKLKINVTASFAFAQNSISSNAYRPSDILTSRNGLTIQIGNTDAEGRLTLADAMDWTQERYKTTHLIQISTLTGAVGVTLGTKISGLFSNDQQLIKQIIQAGLFSHQPLWHLPIFQQHRLLVKPKYADLTNNSGNNTGRVSQSGAFLEAFVHKNVKWAHIDIGMSGQDNGEATGIGAKLLIRLVQRLEKK